MDTYLLACCRYIELNPVRAGMVDVPEKYKWSSYRNKIGIKNSDWMNFDPCYQGLGKTEKERAEGYKEWVQGSIPEGEWRLIRQSVQRGGN